MDIVDLEVKRGLVANSNADSKQLIQVSITTTDIATGRASMQWHNVTDSGQLADDGEPFATATLAYGDPNSWLDTWRPASHLIQGRIEELERLAASGAANRLSRDMAYLLFAKNLVDYADKYRGMQSVVLNGLEAYANVVLTTEKGGSYTVPPFFIDSVAHLAGFVMNVSDAIDTRENYCVTPGWRSMRFARPLEAGKAYRSYVKMIPTVEDPTVYLGDVYVMEPETQTIIGLVQGIQFRRYPRILLSRFFSAPDAKGSSPTAAATARAPVAALAKKETAATTPSADKTKKEKAVAVPDTSAPKAVVNEVKAEEGEKATGDVTKAPAAAVAEATTNNADPAADTTTSKALEIIASEAGLDMAEVSDDSSFAELGVDSLMSLVIAEKFREQLNVVVNGSLFLEYPTLGDLRAWLDEYYS